MSPVCDDILLLALRAHVKRFPPDPRLVAAIDQYRKSSTEQLQPIMRVILHVLEGKS